MRDVCCKSSDVLHNFLFRLNAHCSGVRTHDKMEKMPTSTQESFNAMCAILKRASFHFHAKTLGKGNKMRTKATLLTGIVVICALIAGLYFVRAAVGGYDPRLGGRYQIRSLGVSKNDADEVRLVLGLARGTLEKLISSVEVIDPRQTPIYVGENPVVDTSLGEYVVVITFRDTWIQKDAKQMLSTKGFNPPGIGKNPLLGHVRVTYPPDDAMMVIYLGCSVRPIVDTEVKGNQFVVTLRRN